MALNVLPPSQVFFSYAREDGAAAAAFRASAMEVGIEVWMDTEELSPATLWESEIEHAIARSDMFVAFVTPHYLLSSPCRLEIEQANRQRKRIFPVIDVSVSERQIPSMLSRFHWFRLDSGAASEANLAAFVMALQQALYEDRDRLRMCTDLTTRARRWKAASHDKSLALRGSELKRSRELLGSQRGDAVSAEPPLGDEVLELIAFSERMQSKRRSIVMATFAAAASVFTILAGLAMNASLEAETSQIRSIRSQIIQMANAGDLESLFELAETQSAVVSRDPLSTLQMRLASEDRLRSDGSTEIATNAYWVSVRDRVVLIGGDLFGSKLLFIDDWKEPQRLEAPFADALFDVSQGGTFIAAWKEQSLAIGKVDAKAFVWRAKLPHTIEHIAVHHSGKMALITTVAGLSSYKLVKDQLSHGPLEMHGCGFVTWIGPALILAECKSAPRPGYWLLQIEPIAGSIVRRNYVGQPLGSLRQVLSNSVGTLLLRTQGHVHAFQAPLVAGEDGALELGPGTTAYIGQFPAEMDIGIALANRSPRIAMLRKSGEVLIKAVSQLARTPALKHAPAAQHEDTEFERRIAMQAIRAGAWGTDFRLPVFDAKDERVIMPGGTSRIVSAAGGKTLTNIEGDSSTTSGTGDDAFIRAGKWLIGMSLVHGGRGEISLRRYALPQALQILYGEALAFSLSPNGQTHALYSSGQLVKTDLRSGGQSAVALGAFPAETSAAAVSRSGSNVVVLTPEGKRLSWDSASPTQPAWTGYLADMTDLNRHKPLSMSDESPNEIVVVGHDTSWVLNPTDGAIRCKFDRVDGIPYAGMVSFFRPGLLSSSSIAFTNGTGWENRDLSLIRSSDCKVEKVLVGDGEASSTTTTGFGLAIQLDSSGIGWLADRKFGSRFEVKSFETRTAIGNLMEHKERVLTLLPREDLKLLVSADEDGTVYVWDRETFRQLRRFRSLGCPVATLQMTTDGRYLAAYCAAGKYTVWDLGDYSAAAADAGWMREFASWYLRTTGAVVAKLRAIRPQENLQ